MTLQNMRYLVEIANHKSLSKAASALYMTQSALSAAVKDTENELGIQIFVRSNRGIRLTPDGEDCLKYCREIIERSDRLVMRYQNRDASQAYFSVSAQHLPFAVRAFNMLAKEAFQGSYNAAIYEVPTVRVIEDVCSGKSELGILAIPEDNLQMLSRALHANELLFTKLSALRTYVFFRREHPLASCDSLTLKMLQGYPFVTYDQSDTPIFYTEESVLYETLPQRIYVSDRASKMSVIRSSDAFSIGVDLPNFNRDIYFKNSSTELIAIPFADQQTPFLVGYLQKNDHLLTDTAQSYLELLQQQIAKLSLPGT